MKEKKDFLQRIASTLEQCRSLSNGMFQLQSPVLVALSGGADSVCLLLVLKDLGYDVRALHCNFELRGIESDGDEAFCRRLCRAHNIPLQVKHFRTKSYAERHGMSIEMAARDLRYAWFREEKERQQVAFIAVAHHRDDDAETFFLNLTRGTGIHGLTGMKILSEDILRPLLCVSRSEIESWLTEREQKWVVDSTNLDADVAQRNKLRLDILPKFRELNENFSDLLQDTEHRLAEASALYDKAVEEEKTKVLQTDGSISIEALKHSVAPQTVLFEILRECGYSSAQSQDIFEHLEGESGKVWESEAYRLLRDRGRLMLQAKGANDALPMRVLPLEGYVEVDASLHLKITRQSIDGDFVIPKSPHTVSLDLDKLSLPLYIRRVREGDKMRPFGMTGTRLVSDILTDAKLSVFQKEQQLVVVSGNEIVWLIGLRAAAGYEISPQTRFVMTIEEHK